MKRLSGVTQKQIIECWNNVAVLRAKQIKEGLDLSYDYVLIPTVLKLLEPCDHSRVIDIGCGPGVLSKKFAALAVSVTGIDMSKKMIQIARQGISTESNLTFVKSTIEDYALSFHSTPFSLAIANMTLVTTLDSHMFMQATASLLRHNAHFIITITHPWFWPLYWGYANEEWFDYKKEIFIENVFRISLDAAVDRPKTIHVHRPLELYIKNLALSGFVIEEIYEPIPDSDVLIKYPKPWLYPRFLAMRCIKIRVSRSLPHLHISNASKPMK